MTNLGFRNIAISLEVEVFQGRQQQLQSGTDSSEESSQ
jgi:hypothetical protein